MTDYKFKGAEADTEYETFYATHPAEPDTWAVRFYKDGNHHKSKVLFWGLLLDGMPVPITFDGVWIGSRNGCIMFADRTCVQFEESWPTFEHAAADLMKHDTTKYEGL